jgi:hypothetical protein
MYALSSARPAALARYAAGGGQASGRLEGEARRLEAALGALLARCTEERVQAAEGLAARLFVAARRARELDGWVGDVAAAFRRADAPGAWNQAAIELLGHLSLVEQGLDEAGPFWPLALPALLRAHGLGLMAGGGTIVGRSIGANGPSLAGVPLRQSDDPLNLIERSFWDQAFSGKVDPKILALLAARVDALNLKLRGPSKPPRSPEPRSGPANTVSGAYKAISYAQGEQLVLERLSAGAYRVSIAGLDPKKPEAPNNFLAVILTAYFPPAQNHYYRYVKERFLLALEQIPPGSELHLQGHSMGGGMALLLRADPEIQRRLAELEIRVPTLTLYGAVVPAHGPLDAPPPEGGPFSDTSIRAYVHESDSLARNVGAGYHDYPAMLMIDAGFTDAPAAAHSDYGDPDNYRGLPPSLQVLPYAIDPAVYERPPVLLSLSPLIEPAPRLAPRDELVSPATPPTTA